MTACKFHLQAGASKLGSATNAMDRGRTYIEDLTSLRTGFRFGMSPLSVSFTGIPFRTMVWLWRFPSFAVKWYSSLKNDPSEALFAIHENLFLRLLANDALLWALWFSRCKLMFRPFWTPITNSVLLLRFIRTKVTPGCNRTMTNYEHNQEGEIENKIK